MNARQLKARQIVAQDTITVGAGFYSVGSQYGAGRHRVVVDGLYPGCTCEDYELNGPRECKHMAAVREWLAIKAGTAPAPTPEETTALPPRKTYGQADWRAYNLSKTTEKRWFLTLLADLARDIPDPERKNQRGRPIPFRDALFAAVYKVYSGVSARRFVCDLEEAQSRGLLSGRVPHFNSVLNVFDNEAAGPILAEMVTRSATPLRAVETEWAVDSSGFSGCRYDRWFDEKWGKPRCVGSWVKAHIICGTRTNVIAAAEVLDKDSSDSPQLPGLVATAAQTFTLNEVAGDKAYAGNPNFEAVDKVGGTLYAAFRNNTTGAVGGLFEKAFHYFGLHREEFLTHYHRRSMIESTFSAVKRVYGDGLRSKGERAMRAEAMAKFVAHNIGCVIAAIYERGIDPVFLGLDGEPDTTPREVLPFRPRCTIDRNSAQ